MPTKLVVIIVNWNGRSYIDWCLTSLEKQTFKDFSILLVDNNSGDGSVEYIKARYPKIKTIALKENTGFAKANNIAICATDSQYIATLNNDAVAHPMWAEKLVKALDDNSQAGFAASKMLFFDEPNTIDRSGDAYTIAGAGKFIGRGNSACYYDKACNVFGACAGAAIYRREVMENLGCFDEDFFLLYEDVDLSFRAQLQGYQCCYVPDAIIYHMSSRSIGKDTPISIYFGHRNLEWVYLKNMPIILVLATLVPHVIYVLFSFIFFASSGKGGIFLKAKWAALKGVPEILIKRRIIQSRKVVTSRYIWDLLDKELFIDRFALRFK